MSVQPFGFMADAVPDEKKVRRASLSAATNCPYGKAPGCWLLKYRIAEEGAGWAGFAWQVVPVGKGANWGEFPGKSSASRGFLSVRAYVHSENTSSPSLQFLSGGNVYEKAQRQGSFTVTGPIEEIGTDWRWICLDLRNRT